LHETQQFLVDSRDRASAPLGRLDIVEFHTDTAIDGETAANSGRREPPRSVSGSRSRK
jgi:hypothetical protein